MRRVAIAFAAATLAVTGAVGHAQPKDLTPKATADHLAEIGVWKFAATKKGPDGKPECVETWTFSGDGSGWVQSGEERTTFSWFVEAGDSTDRIVWRKSLTTNGAPDCMGKKSDPAKYPKSNETGFVIMFFNSGHALTCRPAAYVMRNGELTEQRILRDEDCWGSLTPAKVD